MKFILIMILQHYDAGGIAIAEFNDIESCNAAKLWASNQVINTAVRNKHHSDVMAQCFPTAKTELKR